MADGNQNQGREGFGTARVEVGGKVYDRMLSLNLRCSKQDSIPSGNIVLSWPGAQQFGQETLVAAGFLPGALGRILLDGQLAATVAFDTRTSKGSPKSYELTLTFRGKNAMNVDSSAMHLTGQFNNQDPLQIARALMVQGTEIVDKSEGGMSEIARFIIAGGESIERTIRRAARERSLNLWENPEGQWVLESLKKPGLSMMPQAARLIQQLAETRMSVGGLQLGRDFTQWQVKQDIRPRMGNIVVQGANLATDERYGEQNEGIMGDTLREFLGKMGGGRQILERIDTPQDKETIDERADYSAAARDRQAVQATLQMSTWSDRSGNLWRLGDKWHVSIPIDGIDDELEIIAIEFELTKDSRSATLMMTGDGQGAGEWNVMNSAAINEILTEPEEGDPALTTLPPSVVQNPPLPPSRPRG